MPKQRRKPARSAKPKMLPLPPERNIGLLGYEAFDVNNVSLGTYPSQRLAADAISEVVKC
jgi:hypothetical protein